MKTSKISSRILLIGGGHSHVQFLRHWRMHPRPDVEVVLVCDVIHTPYSGMLPGRLAGFYDDADLHFDLLSLCARSGVVFIYDSVVGLNTKDKIAYLRNHPEITFDVASINTGLTPVLPEGAAGNPNVMAVKPISRMLEQWKRLSQEVDRGFDGPLVIVGGGAAGFEVTVAVALLAKKSGRPLTVRLIESGSELLRGHSSAVQRRARKILLGLGVDIVTGTRVERVDGNQYVLTSGESYDFSRMLVTTAGQAPPWLKNTDLKLSDRGFAEVDRDLRAAEAVFAVGDSAHFTASPLAKAGVYAVRQGPVLIENLLRAVGGRSDFLEYTPQKRFLSLMLSGPGRALLSYGPIALEGKWVWRWKDAIDRDFMKKFADAAMAEMDPSVNQCGGCGGKVSANTVGKVVKRLGEDPAVRALLPDAVEDVGYWGDVAATVDGFRAFTGDLFWFGQTAVLHALNDLFASGAHPEGVTVMATLPPAADGVRSSWLFHLMKGVMAALSAHNLKMLNAHTAEGADVSLSIGAVGRAERRWRKGGLKAGQKLVLTKPLGTGGLLQAMMQGRLSEEGFHALQASLLKSHGPWLRDNSIVIAAATDISGFGLVGHISEMLSASQGVDVRLNEGEILGLPGYTELVAHGIAAHLTATNRQEFKSILPERRQEDADSLLFDPQTNGPLLIAVTTSDATALLDGLKQHGFELARVIGEVAPGEGRILI